MAADATGIRPRPLLHRLLADCGVLALTVGFLVGVGTSPAHGDTGDPPTVYYASPDGTDGTDPECSDSEPCSLSSALEASKNDGDAVIYLVEGASGETTFTTSTGWDGATGPTGAARTLTIKPSEAASAPFVLSGGGNASYILGVNPGVTLNIQDITISDSLVDAANGESSSGGGIVNTRGYVIVTRGVFRGNRVSSKGSGSALGGGINNFHGSVDIEDSVFESNNVSVVDDGTARGGGVVNNGGAVSITRSIHKDNELGTSGLGIGYGGGIVNYGGSSKILETVFVRNQYDSSASGSMYGGGIYSAGPVTIVGSTFSENSRGLTVAGGKARVEASTFSGNGVAVLNSAASALDVLSSTFASNMAGIELDGAGAATNIVGSTFVGNTGGALLGAAAGAALAGTVFSGGGGVNCTLSPGRITDGGYNVADDDSCRPGTGAQAATTKTVAPAELSLGATAANGGATQTVLPPPGSLLDHVIPAGTAAEGMLIDGSPVYLCGDTDGAGTHRVLDQRGMPRPLAEGTACAVGAVEGALPAGRLGEPYEVILPSPPGSSGARAATASGLPGSLALDVGDPDPRLAGAPAAAGAFTVDVAYGIGAAGGAGAPAMPGGGPAYRFTLVIDPAASPGGTPPGGTPPVGSSSGGTGATPAPGGPQAPSDGDGPAAVCAEDPFADVPAGQESCGALQWLKEHGITTGYADGTFRPAAATSRAAAAAFLYRAAHPGRSLPACHSAPFADVPASGAFCGAIRWLKAVGLTTGYADGTFRPAAPVTRAAAAAFLSRYAQVSRPAPAGPAAAPCTASPFVDVGARHAFCAEISWLKKHRITAGYAGGTYHPERAASRAAFAIFLQRYGL